MMADVQDVVIFQVNTANPNQYLLNGKWKEFEQRTEKINVRADFPASLRNRLEPIEIKIKETKLGPVISDYTVQVEPNLVLRWIGLEARDTTYESFFQLNKARNWQEFLNAIEYHVAPALNLFYADTKNNIGYKGIGRIPIRFKGEGTLPTTLTKQSDIWSGYVSFKEMPVSYNPASGILFNANNANVDSDYPYVISKDFAHPARANRISQLLAASTNVTKDYSVFTAMQMQLDNKDISALPLLNVMKKLSVTDPYSAKVIELIKAWDGEADKSSNAAPIYYAWLYHLRLALFSDDLRSYWNNQNEQRYLDPMPGLVSPESIAQLLSSDSSWCDDSTTVHVERCAEILERTFQTALKEMTSLYGDEPADWTWQEAHTAVYKHIPFSDMKVLDSIFERRKGSGGASNTINAATSAYSDIDGFESFFGAGFRQVIQMSPSPQLHYLINSTGQSGQVGSQHYDNMLELFYSREYINLNDVKPIGTMKFQPLSVQE
jgi:penicillin amidase